MTTKVKGTYFTILSLKKYKVRIVTPLKKEKFVNLRFSLCKQYPSKITILYKVWTKVFEIEDCNSINVFSKFVDFKILLGKGYSSKIMIFYDVSWNVFKLKKPSYDSRFLDPEKLWANFVKISLFSKNSRLLTKCSSPQNFRYPMT